MAKNREPENSDSEEVEEVSEPESDPETTPTGSAKKAQSEDPESEEEEDGEGSDSESGSETGGQEEVVVKPIFTKPMKSGTKKPNSELVTPSKSSAFKRPAAADSQTKDSKKARTDNSERKNPSLIKRFWSEEDEVALLKGMIKYADKKNVDPVADLEAFHEFIQKGIHVEVTAAQVQDKIRRLRRNFKNSRSKEQQKGKERKFSKPLQREAYALAKRIWENAEGSSLANGSSKKKAPVVASASKEVKGYEASVVASGGRMVKSLAAVELAEEINLMRIGTMAFDGPNADAGTARLWKKLMIEEFKAYGNLLDVRREKVNMVLDFLKS